MPITLNLLEEAEAFLRGKVQGKRRGHGSYVSALLLTKKAEEERKAREEQELSTRQSWEHSGVNVD